MSGAGVPASRVAASSETPTAGTFTAAEARPQACHDDNVEVLSSRVLYRSANFDSLRRFYEGTVGLHVYREYGSDQEILGVVFFLGGGFLEITRASEPSPRITLWLQVRDVRAEQARLRGLGVEVVKPAEQMPWGLIEGWIRDPEGNELRLIEVPEDHPLRRRV